MGKLRGLLSYVAAGPLLLAVAVTVSSVVALMAAIKVVRQRIQWQAPFQRVHQFGEDCEAAIGIAGPNWQPEAAIGSQLEYSPYPVPRGRRPEVGGSKIQVGQYRVIRCVLDLSGLAPEGFGVIKILRSSGRLTAFVGFRKALTQADQGIASIPLLPEERRSNVFLYLVYEPLRDSDAVAGPVGVAPLYFTDDRGADEEIMADAVGHNKRLFYLFDFMLVLSSLAYLGPLWIAGWRYSDVFWLLVSTCGYGGYRAFDFLWSGRPTYSLFDSLSDCLLILYGIGIPAFIYSGLRLKRLLPILPGFAILVLAVFFSGRLVFENSISKNMTYLNFFRDWPGYLIIAMAIWEGVIKRADIQVQGRRRRHFFFACLAWYVLWQFVAYIRPLAGTLPTPFFAVDPILLAGGFSILASIVLRIPGWIDTEVAHEIAKKDIIARDASIASAGQIQQLTFQDFERGVGVRSVEKFRLLRKKVGEITSDWYGHWTLDDGRDVFVLGTVIGSGAATAVVSATIRGIIYLKNGSRPDDFLRALNDCLFDLYLGFVSSTALVVMISQDGRVETFNCGDVGWVVFPNSFEIRSTGKSHPIGTGQNPTVSRSDFRKPDGSSLICFTEGYLRGNRRRRRLQEHLTRELALVPDPSLDQVCAACEAVPSEGESVVLVLK